MKKNNFSVMHKIVALVLLVMTVPPVVFDALQLLHIVDPSNWGEVLYYVGMWSAWNIWIAIPISIVALILGNTWGRVGGLTLLARTLIVLLISLLIRFLEISMPYNILRVIGVISITLLVISSVAGLISLFSRK